jgi:endonuclease YncB( thermonuclease family)
MGNCFQNQNKVDEGSQNQNKVDEDIKVDVDEGGPKEIDLYKDCTYENTPYYSYENLKKKIKILKIIDGDTVDIALHHDETNKIFKYRVRLYGIDTPEKRPLKSNPNRDKEIAASKRSSEALRKILQENNNIVVGLFYKPDKDGRLLCTLYDKNGEDINKWMVLNGYAYEYFGKTKEKYKEDSE